MAGPSLNESFATKSGVKRKLDFGPSGPLLTQNPYQKKAPDEAIEAARTKGILGVEMEAAALYAFARSSGVRLLCLAHVTNTMGQDGADFEKGEADGTQDALSVLSSVIEALYSAN